MEFASVCTSLAAAVPSARLDCSSVYRNAVVALFPICPSSRPSHAGRGTHKPSAHVRKLAAALLSSATTAYGKAYHPHTCLAL